MKKAFCLIVFLTLAVSAAVNISAEGRISEAEAVYLARAIAVSYPDVSFGGRVAIAAVVLNRTGAVGFPESSGGAIMSLWAEGEFPNLKNTSAKIDKKLLGRSVEAVDAAVSGADPTGGALFFERIENTAGRDLRFDDSTEDRAAEEIRHYFFEKYGAEVTVLDGIGFW